MLSTRNHSTSLGLNCQFTYKSGKGCSYIWVFFLVGGLMRGHEENIGY